MIERYDYKITDNNAFLAGFLLCTLNGDNHQPSLFHSLRIIRILEGVAVLRIDNTEYTLQPGDVVPLNNLVPRQFVKIYTPEFKFELFAFSPLVLKRESICMSLFYSLPNSFNPIISKEAECAQDLHMLLDVLKNKFISYREGGFALAVVSDLITAVAVSILDIITSQNAFEVKSESFSNTAKLVADAIQYIFENISEPMTVSDFAKRANVSREYFGRVFRKFVGHTASSFINHCRTDNVIYLVKHNNMRILDAAMESGFNSASGFYRAFRSVHGTCPKQLLEKGF